MEKRQKEQVWKEQVREEMSLNELEKVNGGIVIPQYPVDPDHDENSDNNGGGATGGW